jgi:hypothetical protein
MPPSPSQVEGSGMRVDACETIFGESLRNEFFYKYFLNQSMFSW